MSQEIDLAACGWTVASDIPGMWENRKEFHYTDADGHHCHVPAGIVCTPEYAREIESHRPK